jgi:hypothetical protein
MSQLMDATMKHVTAYVQQFERNNNLPALTGTDKQIAWARTIRCQFLSEVATIDPDCIGGLTRIKLASRWIEEIRPYLGHAERWLSARAEKAKQAAMTPAEARAAIWQRAESHKDKFKTFDLIGFMRHVAEQDDQWVKRWQGRSIAEMNKRRHALAKVIRMAESAA